MHLEDIANIYNLLIYARQAPNCLIDMYACVYLKLLSLAHQPLAC
jgi:hypothetical protein